MTMSIGGANVALVESRHSGMWCEAHPTRLALVLALIDNGALGVDGLGYGSDAHKAALAKVAEQVAQTQARIAEREKRDAYLEFVRDPWIKQAAARYMERGLDEDEAREAATSLFGLIATEGDGEMQDATNAADEDMATWTA